MEYSITLNGEEIELARSVGEKRHEQNRSWGSKNLRASPRSDVEINIEGFAGEIAFARMFNCELDMGDTPRVHDTTLHDVTVDVKTFKWENANLLVPENKKDKQCEIYVQMLGAMPTFTFAGWATNHDVFGREPEQYPLDRINYVVRKHELRLPGELFGMHKDDLRKLVE